MGSFRVEEATYRIAVEVDGNMQVHDATLSNEYSAWPETAASCSCGFSYGPRRTGAFSALREHFAEVGVDDAQPVERRTIHL
jgi:hypothetical protein